MKHFFLLLIASVLFATNSFAQEGTCGENLKWTFSERTLTLTISGTGTMDDYRVGDNPSPWNSYSSYIRTIVIEDGVTNIGKRAFYYCLNVSDVTVPESVTGIEESAFFGCHSLVSIAIPDGVTDIGKTAFLECKSLTSITVPARVASIGDGAFFSCWKLTAINVENDNENYASEDGVLFDKAKTQLIRYPEAKEDENYTIPEGVTTIRDKAFYDCFGLTSVTIPQSVISIGEWAFGNCFGLTAITIPENVTSIGDYAFYNCDRLTSVTNLSRIPQIVNKSIFSDIYIIQTEAVLHVPAASVNVYKAASVWEDFNTIEAYNVPTGIETAVTEAAVGVSFNPLSESFRIEGVTRPTQVSVTDVSGKTVLRQTVKGDESISAGHLPQGIYLIRVNGRTAKIFKSF
jgi:hypothetical protein